MSDDTMSQEKETVGQRVERAMDTRGIGYNEVDRGLGYSEGYTSRLVHSTRQPRADTLAKLAEVLRVDLAWLASGKGSMGEESPSSPASSGPRAKVAKDLPGWAEALGLAVLRWRRIPTSAWAAVSMLSFDNPPERITPDFIFEAAQGWLKQASDDELAAAEEADTRRVMAEEDAAYLARTSPLAPAVIPTNPGPTKAVPRKKSAKLGEGFPCF
jgi:hypothetical protein